MLVPFTSFVSGTSESSSSMPCEYQFYRLIRLTINPFTILEAIFIVIHKASFCEHCLFEGRTILDTILDLNFEWYFSVCNCKAIMEAQNINQRCYKCNEVSRKFVGGQ